MSARAESVVVEFPQGQERRRLDARSGMGHVLDFDACRTRRRCRPDRGPISKDHLGLALLALFLFDGLLVAYVISIIASFGP